MNKLSLRSLQLEDIPKIVNYWFSKSEADLQHIGCTKETLGKREPLQHYLESLLHTPIEHAFGWYQIWLFNGEAIGYACLRNIKYNDIADIHLHIWNPELRGKKLGPYFFAMSVIEFYTLFNFKIILCEPKAANPSPNNLLNKIGFKKWRTYTGAPANICSICELNSYIIDLNTAEQYLNGRYCNGYMEID